MKILAPIMGNDKNSEISPRFARSPYLAIIEIENNEIRKLDIIENEFRNLPRGAGVALAQWIVNNNFDGVIGINFGPNLLMILNQAGIKIYRVEQTKKLTEALRELGFIE